MADKDSGNGADKPEPKGAAASQDNATPPQPGISILTQYVKDLSYENPMVPRSLAKPSAGPKIEIGVNVNAKPISEDTFEVDLTIEAKAKANDKDEDAGKVIFATDLTYGGVFKIQNIPQESLHPVILIECPRILFPFARQIIAEATRNGGFPPLLIDPIDFSALYRQKLEGEKAGAAPTASVSPT